MDSVRNERTAVTGMMMQLCKASQFYFRFPSCAMGTLD
jgi:hypothetical protein